MQKRDSLFFGLIIIIAVGLCVYTYFSQKSLQENQNKVALKQVNLINDENLLGGAGLEFGHAGRIWLNTLDGHSIVYSGQGEVVNVKDTTGNYIPLAVEVPETPTGLVFTDSSVKTPNIFMGDAFAFVTLEGKIFGWHKLESGLEPVESNLRIDSSKTGAKYSGATLATVGSTTKIYVADFANNKIEMYDQNYKLLKADFSDPNLNPDYSVYNVKNIDNYIYATYRNKHGNVGGAIDIFDLDGKFIKRLVTDGALNSPWGLATTNNTFSNVTGNLLVGNSGDGKINLYEKTTGKFIQTISDETGKVLQIPGLMALTFGTNNGAGKVNELFFSAGGSDKKAVFGKLELVLENTPDSSLIKRGGEQSVQTEEEKIEQEFLTGENFDISYSDFKKDLNRNCIEDCLKEKLNSKSAELNTLYNKIISDTQIIKKEFLAQNYGGTSTQKLDNFVLQLVKLDPKKFLNNTESFCEITANNYYVGDTAKRETDTCLLYKTENWLKELYVLRSIFVRVELGPLGIVHTAGKKIITKDFADLINQEESRIDKSY